MGGGSAKVRRGGRTGPLRELGDQRGQEAQGLWAGAWTGGQGSEGRCPWTSPGLSPVTFRNKAPWGQCHPITLIALTPRADRQATPGRVADSTMNSCTCTDVQHAHRHTPAHTQAVTWALLLQRTWSYMQVTLTYTNAVTHTCPPMSIPTPAHAHTPHRHTHTHCHSHVCAHTHTHKSTH